MIITGGMNVYSVEVENALFQHTSIQDAAIIGVPDPDWGEAVVAVITSDTEIAFPALKKFLSERLSAYKLPKEVHRIHDLPLTPYGKIDKKALRQMHRDGAFIQQTSA